MDPLELRLRNDAETDEASQRPWSSKHVREAYQLGAERFGWSKRNPQIGSMRRGAEDPGLGHGDLHVAWAPDECGGARTSARGRHGASRVRNAGHWHRYLHGLRRSGVGPDWDTRGEGARRPGRQFSPPRADLWGLSSDSQCAAGHRASDRQRRDGTPEGGVESAGCPIRTGRSQDPQTEPGARALAGQGARERCAFPADPRLAEAGRVRRSGENGRRCRPEALCHPLFWSTFLRGGV